MRRLIAPGLAGILLVAGAAAAATGSHAQAPVWRHHPPPTTTARHDTKPASTTTVSRRGTKPPSTTTAVTTVASPAVPVPKPVGSSPVHTGITATVFWIGEPVGNGSTEDNAVSAYDDFWLADYGGFDDYRTFRTYPFFPAFTPHENPFYLDLPYDDVNVSANRSTRATVVPWASQFATQLASKKAAFSLMKNHWVALWRSDSAGTHTCYAQVEDAGPYVYNDAAYVFGTGDPRPRSTKSKNAGLDVSPALRDCLHFDTLNDQNNKVSWQFVDAGSVPSGPWTTVVTTRQVNQP
jgi:hypothetical protein